MQRIDYMLIGPSHPYRGGIAQTQNESALSLIKLGKNVRLITFKKLYPNYLFPGKSQYTSEPESNQLKVERLIHSYNPINWMKVADTINKINPKVLVFRYYNPLLALCYSGILFKINNKIKKIALVDNWTHHEPKFYDKFLNTLFKKRIDSFITLSDNVAQEIKNETKSDVFSGFHPIGNNLPKIIAKSEARKKLGWDMKAKIVLFYGLVRPYKGLDNLLKAFGTPPLSESNVKLAITGEFYEPLKKYLRLINKLELKKKIYLIPKFSNLNNTQLYFCSADVVSLTYKSATQSGVIPLSYHFQTPLVVTNLSGLKTPVLRDNSGLISSHDPKDISIKLMKILEPRVNLRFIKNIKSTIKKYSWNEYSKHIINFIEKIN